MLLFGLVRSTFFVSHLQNEGCERTPDSQHTVSKYLLSLTKRFYGIRSTDCTFRACSHIECFSSEHQLLFSIVANEAGGRWAQPIKSEGNNQWKNVTENTRTTACSPSPKSPTAHPLFSSGHTHRALKQTLTLHTVCRNTNVCHGV